MKRREFLGAAGSFALMSAAACTTGMEEKATAGALPEESAQDLILPAFHYGYALYEFSRTASASVARGRQMNTLGHRTFMSDHTHRTVTAPNLDTLYSSAFLELSGGPMEVVTPDAEDRYHSITFMNAFTDNFAILGTRTTGGRSVRAWIVGPEWQGDVPAGVRLVRSDTNDVWMLGRTLVEGPEDLEAAKAVQAQIKLNPVPGRGPVQPFETKTAPIPDAPMFIAAVNEMLGRSPTDVGQAQRASTFAAAGIRPGDGDAWQNMSASLQDAWSARLPAMIDDLRRNSEAMMVTRKGWRASPVEVGSFGENDALRASIALWGLAALPAEEAGYYRASRDAEGEVLDGTKAYKFHLPPEGVPADAFWSLTMYSEEPDGRFFLVDNPIRRYALSDRSQGLKSEPDGSIVILMQPEPPADDAVSNWLPTPRGPFAVSLRAYLPRKPIREGKWTPPPIERVAPR